MESENFCAGEPVEKTITLDIDTIVRGAIEELDVLEAPAGVNAHFTEITLVDPYDKLQAKTGSKINACACGKRGATHR